MARSLKIVLYAVNGSGVGHLTRLVAIARWLRRYANYAAVRPELYFLTSSEAGSLLQSESFASFKLPSKTTVDSAGIDKLAYLALAKQWVWHSLGLLRPDLFVVDTFPRGAFGELLSALDLCKKRAFIYRPVKPSFASRPDFQAMLPLYDLLIVPEREGQSPILTPDTARSRLRYTGPTMLRERVEMLSRHDARARLNIAPDDLAIYISAGGGGDETAEAQLNKLYTLLKDRPSTCLVIAAGPLYRGCPIFANNVRWLNHPGTAELLPGMDMAICAAGYNTYHELMFAGVPAVFLPQAKIADEQDLRAREAEALGAALVLPHAYNESTLLSAVDHFACLSSRIEASKAAAELVPHNYARNAAAELLRLVLPASEVDAAEEAIADPILRIASDLSVSLDQLIDLMHALDRPTRAQDPRIIVDLCSDILLSAKQLNIPSPAAIHLGSLLARKLHRAEHRLKANAVQSLLAAFAPFQDWPGAATLVKQLTPETRPDLSPLLSELTTFLSTLGDKGYDLYGGVALLSSAHGLCHPALSNQAVLAKALAHLRDTDSLPSLLGFPSGSEALFP